MEVTVLGSGGPPPTTSLGGQSVLLEPDDGPLLLDCGPLTVERLLENRVQLADITNLLFSHQHMDHNASFFHFAISSWMYGRRDLSVYGPSGTEALLDALVDIYADDLDYRREFGRPTEGITDISFQPVTASFEESIAGANVSVQPVDHTIETYAYKVEADSGTVVYSADTANPSPLEEFAKDADILLQNCGLGPEGSAGTEADRESWRQYRAHNPPPEQSPIADQHCSPEQAARVGAMADVDTLVLTHLLPMRDTDAIRKRVAEIFSGDIHIAKNGLTLAV